MQALHISIAPREKSAALFHLNQAATLVNTLRRNKHADPEEANFSTAVRTLGRQFPFAKRLVKTSTVPLLELFLAKRRRRFTSSASDLLVRLGLL
ncbi:Uncharacterized protein TSPI_10318 [Trichinella spiralis]|uniref:Transposase n=1 Tax=Trichinella spiralis TaxID=6334 RepID=A0ABR3KM98_TRISP